MRRQRVEARSDGLLGLVIAWAAGALAAALAPLKFLDHYFLLVVPGLALLAALPLGRAGRRFPAGRVAVAAAALAAVGVTAAARVPEALDRWRRLPSRVDAAHYHPAVVGAWLRAHSAPDDTVYVWRSLDVDIYYHARRRPASRFFFWVHVVREPKPPGADRLFRQDFERRPPRFVVVGDSPVLADTALPWLEERLRTEYTDTQRIGPHRVLRRATGP
jgi:hypothetical protein